MGVGVDRQPRSGHHREDAADTEPVSNPHATHRFLVSHTTLRDAPARLSVHTLEQEPQLPDRESSDPVGLGGQRRPPVGTTVAAEDLAKVVTLFGFAVNLSRW